MTNIIPRSLARLAALAIGAAFASGVALAQSATEGKALYEKTFVSGIQSCRSCHGTPTEDPAVAPGADATRIKAATSSKAKMMPLRGFITDAEFNHIAKYIGDTLGKTPTYIAVTPTPSATVSATSLTFASQNLATTSAAQTVTVGNATGATAALAISSIGVTAGSDFAVTGGSCSAGGSVAAGASCTVNVVFKPTAVGDRSSTLTIAHNGTGGKSTVSLSGAAVNTSPAITVSPTALTFSSVVATDSTAKRVTISNTGTGPLVLSALTLGGSQSSDYRLIASSTCQAGGTVAGGSSCVADVVFTPGAMGTRSGTLTIAHNATGSPSTVSFSGTGTATPEPGIALDATSIDLGAQVVAVLSSSKKTLTLTNSGGSALVLGSIGTNGADAGSFVLGGTCTNGLSVPAQGTCTVTVEIKPVTLGVKTATLTIASNAKTGEASVALRATSVNTPAPEVSLSQAAVGFGSVTFNTQSMGRVVRLTNSGTAPMTVTSIVSTSAEYVSSHDCPASLAVAASCTITIVYKPTTDNSAESVVLTTNAISSPNSIVVTGQGTSTSLPVLAWQPAATSLTFASTVVGVSSASQGLTLVNKGPGAVTLTSLGTAGAAASSFAIASGSTCKVGLALAVNATCTVSINFVPGSTGSKVANLQVGSTGTPPGDVVLSGTGASPNAGTGTVTVSSSTLDFSSIGAVTGSTSAPLNLVVSNGSAASAAISSIKLTGPFALQSGVSGACATGASTLAAGSSCTLSVVYSPTAAGASTGTLTITVGTQTVDVALKGQATAATPKLAWPANATSWPFSSTTVGSTSAVQSRTLTNQGPGSVTLSAVTTAGTDAAAFVVSGTSTCKAGTTIASGASCTVALAFSPTSSGAKSATLRVESNGTPPGDVALSGSGMAASAGTALLTADKAQLDFTGTAVAPGQTSTPMQVAIANGNVAAVTLTKTEVTGPFKVSANTCAATLAVNANCTISVTFVPTSGGSASGTLMLTTGSGQMIAIGLSGLSVSSGPVLAWQAGTPTAVQFDNTAVGRTSAGKSFVLTNQGPGAVTFTSIGTDGTGKAAFTTTSQTSCRTSTSLAQGASCVVSIGFAPAAAGTHAATLKIASNASAPATISLSGTGTTTDTPTGSANLTADMASLGFSGVMGHASNPETAQFTNTGTTTLTLTDIGTTGPFQVVNSASGGCTIPQTLAPNASCAVSVAFVATTPTGDSTGVLTVTGAGGENRTVLLAGRAMVANAGANNADGDDSGGGAIDLLALAGLALLLLAGYRARRAPNSF